MKVFGIILLVFSAINFIVALIASANGATNAAGQKFSATILLMIVGGILYYKGNKRSQQNNNLKSVISNGNESFYEQDNAHNRTEQHQEQIQKQKELEHQKNSKKFKLLNFYLKCAYCEKQEAELKKCPIALPIQQVDVENEDEILQKYKVHQLPKIILVDYNGREIHRWIGVTTADEINDYLFQNKFVSNGNLKIDINESFSKKVAEEDEKEYPRPLKENLTRSDMAILQSKYMDECLAIMADGGTKDQTKIKFELLLGKRKKTSDMIRIEEQVRSLYREIFDEALSEFRNADTGNLLIRLAATTKLMEVYNDFNNEDGEGHKTKQLFIDIANKYGISVNIIEQEEHTRALSRFENSKKPASF